jgi:hypothetical protein
MGCHSHRSGSRTIRTQQSGSTEVDKARRMRINELSVKGFNDKEIDLIINFGYSEEQIIKMRDVHKKPIPQQENSSTEKNQQYINVNIGKIVKDSNQKTPNIIIKDSVIQRSNIGPEQSGERINICPYCNKDLKFPKTPKFCPYCEEQILM